MTRWTGSIVVCLLASLLGGGVLPAEAQSDSVRTVIARFRDAEALSVDPLGRIYVADAGGDVVHVLDRTGANLGSLGGAGTRAGEFDGPADVDPTNGQSVWVADAGNGRVQRFSEEGLYLESITVGLAPATGADQRAFDDGRDGATIQGDGRPIAVASSSGDETFVIDGRSNTVIRWDEQRRPERIVGAVGQREGALIAPVALALDGSRRLYVADEEQGAVLSYDLFGTFVRRLEIPSVPGVRALTIHRGRLWIVCAERVFVWDPDTRSVVERAVDLPAPLVDVARQGDELFLLTPSNLYRRPTW